MAPPAPSELRRLEVVLSAAVNASLGLPAQERPERVAPDETEDAGLLALVLASLAAMIGFAAPFGGF